MLNILHGGLLLFAFFVTSWNVAHADSEWTYDMVARAICAMPFLEELALGVRNSMPVKLRCLPGLRRLSLNIGFVPTESITALARDAAALIASAPELENISIASRRPLDVTEFFTLCALEKPLKLKRIELAIPCHSTLRDGMVPHLKYLKTLQLRDNITIERVTAPLGSLWLNLLISENIAISHLELSIIYVDKNILALLATMPSLRSLSLNHSRKSFWSLREIVVGDREDAELFYTTVLEHHASTLTSLVIKPDVSGAWCFESCYLGAFTGFTNLRYFALALNKGDEENEDFIVSVPCPLRKFTCLIMES